MLDSYDIFHSPADYFEAIILVRPLPWPITASRTNISLGTFCPCTTLVVSFFGALQITKLTNVTFDLIFAWYCLIMLMRWNEPLTKLNE